jgi:hypothetical protein
MASVVVRILCSFQWKNQFFASCCVSFIFSIRCDPQRSDLRCGFCSWSPPSLPYAVGCSSSLGCVDCSRIRLFSSCSSVFLVFLSETWFLVSSFSIDGGPCAVQAHASHRLIFSSLRLSDFVFPSPVRSHMRQLRFLQWFFVSSHLFFGSIHAHALKVFKSSHFWFRSSALA